MIDLKRIIVKDETLVSIDILYYRLDYENLLQNFFWQTLDKAPYFPRTTRFLKFWESDVKARIEEVRISDPRKLVAQWRNGIVIPV